MSDDRSENLIEDGIPAGTWNKYGSKNPVQNYLVSRFLHALSETARGLQPECRSALDVGCGEGVSTQLLFEAGFEQIRGCDFSGQILERARADYPQLTFEQKDISALTSADTVDFVAACEVLEHLEEPEAALEKLAVICRVGGIISVPNEPLFRGLNFLAGKYWREWGNSPGHLNHWSSRSIRRTVARFFDVEQVVTSLPWTILTVRPKRR